MFNPPDVKLPPTPPKPPMLIKPIYPKKKKASATTTFLGDFATPASGQVGQKTLLGE